jgi:hypothetical protein
MASRQPLKRTLMVFLTLNSTALLSTFLLFSLNYWVMLVEISLHREGSTL